MELAVVLSHSEMELLWEKRTSFSHQFDFNPFDSVWERANGWHYESHRIGSSWNPKTLKYEPDAIKPFDEIKWFTQEEDSQLCTQAILEWIANGIIPETKLVLVDRDW